MCTKPSYHYITAVLRVTLELWTLHRTFVIHFNKMSNQRSKTFLSQCSWLFTNISILHINTYFVIIILFAAKALTQETAMQLHILETHDNSGPFLIQMLWGRMISAVIYRKSKVRSSLPVDVSPEYNLNAFQARVIRFFTGNHGPS